MEQIIRDLYCVHKCFVFKYKYLAAKLKAHQALYRSWKAKKALGNQSGYHRHPTEFSANLTRIKLQCPWVSHLTSRSFNFLTCKKWRVVTPRFYDLVIIQSKANLPSIFFWKVRCFRSPIKMVFNLVWVSDDFETPVKAIDTSPQKNSHMDKTLYIISREFNDLLMWSMELKFKYNSTNLRCYEVWKQSSVLYPNLLIF